MIEEHRTGSDCHVLQGANVVVLGSGQTLADWSIIVRGGRIVEMRPSHETVAPEGATVIDCAGGYLLPGFADMHVHIGFPALVAHGNEEEHVRLAAEAADDMLLYLANGVTTVRNMSGADFHLRLAAQIDGGRIPGPRLRTTSAILDGVPPVWDFSPRIADAGDARRAVKEIREKGYEAIKVYNHVSAPAYRALIEEGAASGLPVVGHVPFAIGIHGALSAGQHCIEHFRGYDFDPGHPPGASGVPDRFATWLSMSERQLDAYTRETEKAGTWNCPTLVVVDSGVEAAGHGVASLSPAMRYVAGGLRDYMTEGVRNPVFPPDILQVLGEGKPKQLAFLKRLHQAGNRLVVGTDCSILSIVPGFSIHDEMENFVAAGLTCEEALICCCVNPARYYAEDDWGMVDVGQRADLVLLRKDPRREIGNTRTIEGVMAAGTWHGRQALDQGLERLARKYPMKGDNA